LTAPAASPLIPSSRRIPQLDGLRGIAVLLVVLYHYVYLPGKPTQNWIVNHVQATFQLGWAGVDLFFVLSGFLIGGILLDARGSTNYFSTFYLRRVHRIFPIYYIWIGAYFFVAFTGLIRWAGPLGIAQDRWTTVPVYTLFLQNTVRNHGGAFASPWLAALWSLAVEEQFYLLAPSLVRWLSKRGLVISIVLAIVGAPMVRMLVFRYLPTHAQAPYVLTPCRADALAMGVFLALAWREERWKAWLQGHLKWLYGALALLSGSVYLIAWGKSAFSWTTAVWGYSCIDAFFSGLLILVLLRPEGLWARICKWPFLIEMGGISYCAYVIHLSVNHLCHSILSVPTNGIATLASLAVTIAAAGVLWLISKLSWRCLESPMIRRGHRFKY
jgi:peptidoglycan/LPS O-acetylase OafA/YrhL